MNNYIDILLFKKCSILNFEFHFKRKYLPIIVFVYFEYNVIPMY